MAGPARVYLMLAVFSATTAGCRDDPTVVQQSSPAEPADWAMFGGDPAHSRHSRGERKISRDTVATLAVSWEIPAPGVTSTPAIVDGVVYYADWMGGVYAKDASNGSEVWTVQLAAGVTSSLLVTEDRVYVSDRAGVVHSLVRDTGATFWSERVDQDPHVQLWSSPALAGTTLVVGVGGRGTQQGGEPLPEADLQTFRGAVVGLDAFTGSPRWRVETTIDDDGNEFAPGSSVWSSAAVDPDLRHVYIGTGNCYFQPASPFSDSLLAIDYESGKRVWHRQFTEGDGFRSGAGEGFDFDVGAAPNLFEAASRKLVGVGDKAGLYHVLDRETGELVWEKQLSTGSAIGGIMAPAAVADDVIYVASNETATLSRIFALAVSDGTQLWMTDVPTMTFGGPVVANGVLFVGPADGILYAFDVRDGAELWTHALERPRGGGLSIVDGKLFTGSGFHFFDDARDPLPDGGLLVFGVAGG